MPEFRTSLRLANWGDYCAALFLALVLLLCALAAW